MWKWFVVIVLLAALFLAIGAVMGAWAFFDMKPEKSTFEEYLEDCNKEQEDG